MKRVIWSQASLGDLRDIRDYYTAEVSADAAQVMLDRIILAADWLLGFPAAGPAIGYRRWRKWRPRKTPHVLIYQPTRSGIEVVRVWHAQQEWRVVPD